MTVARGGYFNGLIGGRPGWPRVIDPGLKFLEAQSLCHGAAEVGGGFGDVAAGGTEGIEFVFGAAFAAAGTGWVVRTTAATTAVRDRLTGDIARKTISAVTANGRGSADPNGSGSTTAPGVPRPRRSGTSGKTVPVFTAQSRLSGLQSGAADVTILTAASRSARIAAFVPR